MNLGGYSMYSEDAYCLGLLYAHIYANKKMVLKDDLDKFHEIIESNLRSMNNDINDTYATVWYDNDPSIYFVSEGKNGEIYYVLYPNFDLDRAKSKYIGCLSTDVLVASQKENALNSIDLKKENGRIVKKKINELRIPTYDFLKDVEVCEIKHSEDHIQLQEAANRRIEEGRRREAKAWHAAKDFHVGTSAVDVETKQESSFEKSTTGEEIRKIMRIKTSKIAFNEQDFIKLLLSKLLKNGISKIDPMKLKYLLADYYSKEEYAFLFEDLALKEQIEGNYVEFDDALVFAHFAGLLSNPIQGTNMCMIWSSLEDVSSNYSIEYNLKMDELAHNLSSRLNIKNNSINQSQDSREATSKQDEIEKELYEVRVFNEDDRKNNESCKLEQHKALLYIDDVSEKYSNDMENNVYYECICLECGKNKDYKMSLDDRRHIIKTNLSPMETFMSFYEVRKRYLELIKQNCTVEEIIDNLNSFYKKNQEQGPVLTKKKN